MTRRHWTFLALALLLGLLLILIGRWILRDAPGPVVEPEIKTERDGAAPESAQLELPKEKTSSGAASPKPEIEVTPSPTKIADAPMEVNAVPPQDKPAEDKVAVSYGAQVFVAGVIEDYRLTINGEPSLVYGQRGAQDLTAMWKYLAVERYLFVSDEWTRGQELKPNDMVRTYTPCGIGADHFAQPSTTTDRDGTIVDVRYPNAWIPESSSDLAHLQARKGPTDSIVVAAGEQANSDWSGARWNLGLSIFLPDGPVAIGSRWTIPASCFAQVLSPGSDLKFHRLEHDSEKLAAITPGALPTQKQLGSLTGDSIATYDGERPVGSRECHEASIAINVSGKSEDETLGDRSSSDFTHTAA